MSSGLAPLAKVQCVCADCGADCRQTIERNTQTGKIRSVINSCDPCKRSWRTSLAHVNAETVKYVAPPEEELLAESMRKHF